jgi:hypothetical protein
VQVPNIQLIEPAGADWAMLTNRISTRYFGFFGIAGAMKKALFREIDSGECRPHR